MRTGACNSNMPSTPVSLTNFHNGILTHARATKIHGRVDRDVSANAQVRKGSLFLTIEKLTFQAVIRSAASTASLDLQGSLAAPALRMQSRRLWAPLQIHGGSASSRFDHGLKVLLFSHKLEPEILHQVGC